MLCTPERITNVDLRFLLKMTNQERRKKYKKGKQKVCGKLNQTFLDYFLYFQ